VNTNTTIEMQGQASANTKTTAKKPYVKPEVRHERVFETQALTCGKVQTTQSGCHQNRKTS
jgi:hypothetical protein